MRVIIIILIAFVALPALAASTSKEEARLLYLEKRVGELEGDHRELRAYADRTAKSEADGVRDILTHVEWAAGSIIALLMLIFGLGALNAGDKARRVAKAEMDGIRAELDAKASSWIEALAFKEQQAMAALQEKGSAMVAGIEGASRRAHDAADDAEKIRAGAVTDADKVRTFLENLVNQQAAFPTEPEDVEPKAIESYSVGELMSLTQQAMDKGPITDAARYVSALVRRLPDDPNALILLSRVRLSQGLSGEALDAAEKAVTEARRNGNQHSEFIALLDMGNVQRDVRNTVEALAAFQLSLELARKHLESAPDDPAFRRALAGAWAGIGDTLLASGDNAGAGSAFGHCRRIVEDLASDDPDNAQVQQDLVAALRNCARAALAEGQAEVAANLLTRSVAILEKHRAGSPDRPIYQRGKAGLDGLWGDHAQATGDLAQARQRWGEAVATLETLEHAGTLDWLGRRTLKEYRDKLAPQ